MAHNPTADKPVALNRRTFLGALYQGCPDDLYLELRCIHPETGEVKTLWSKVGDKRRLTSSFKQADALNRDGFGLYFAPCLRSQSKGSAESAALVPALWLDVDIDTDGDSTQRDRALEKLRAFDPKPSFTVASGGGWHSYWLLDAPFALTDDTTRTCIADVLRGLATALGGDPAYVKSVASVMRLPGSINTKPERNGAVVSIVEGDPIRRYTLATFDWLRQSFEPQQVGNLKVVTQNGNGHHPLPKRTEDYLIVGATEGNRNKELFQAACQLRDAGYSQSDAEGQLVPRYVADGCNEREAVASIHSAYSRPQREPLPDHAGEARGRIARLIESHQPTQERPSPQAIAETVEACAHLNAIEWADARAQLKTLCGDGLKTSDLDRMYRQARRQIERTNQSDTEESERYTLVDGAMIFERTTDRGTFRQKIAGWSGKVVERISRMDDDGQVEHLTRLELCSGEEQLSLTLPSELFGDPNALHRAIAGRAGETFTTRAGMQRHLGAALLALSGTYPRRSTYRFLGWSKVDGRWTYLSPNCAVNADGIAATPPEVELETRLRDYALTEIPWAQSIEAFLVTLRVFPKSYAAALTAFALLPLFQRFFPTAAPKPALHLVGTTGSGKSEIAALMTSFYGQFSRDQPPAQWSDTVNTVETLGYPLADALFWVDDYKSIYADEKTFTRFLQSYSRGMGRGRLTKEAKVRQERPCRGLLLSTGETTLEGEASVLARMLVLEIPPWEKRDPGGKALLDAEQQRPYLNGFTAHLARWIAGRTDAGTLEKELAERFARNCAGYRAQLNGKGSKAGSSGRVVQNWAVLVTVYQLIRQFLAEQDADDLLPTWEDNAESMLQSVQEERAGQLFLDTLSQLLASGEVMLATDLRQPEEPRPGTTLIGYQSEGAVYLLPEVAYRAVTRVQPLKFTSAAVGAQLKEEGILTVNPNDTHLGVQIRVRGARVRVWRLKGDSLGGDAGGSGDRV
jgi:hypothetical protein